METTPAALEAAIVSVCGTRDGLKPVSFVSNRLPLLTLPEDVLQVLNKGEVHYSKARHIALIPDPATRATLLELAPKHSVRKIQQIVSNHRKTVFVTTDRTAQRIDEAKQILAEINARAHHLKLLGHNDTSAVLHALQRARTRLP